MSYDVGEVTEMLDAHSPTFPSFHLRHSSFSNPSVYLPTSQLILQSFRCFTYEQSPFSNLSVTSPTSQLILQPFRRSTYVKAHFPTLPLLHLHHSSFSNSPFASPTSQALHLRHLASHSWAAMSSLMIFLNIVNRRRIVFNIYAGLSH